jgi:hypothetical protein
MNSYIFMRFQRNGTTFLASITNCIVGMVTRRINPPTASASSLPCYVLLTRADCPPDSPLMRLLSVAVSVKLADGQRQIASKAMRRVHEIP